MSLKKGLVLDLDISSEGLQGTTKFKDKTPYENNGTLSNVTLTTDHKGKANSAGLFNGTNSYIDCGNNSSLDITGAITMSAWIKASNTTSFQTLFGKGDSFSSGGKRGYSLGIYNTNIYFNTSDSVQRDNLQSLSGTVKQNEWFFLTATWDGTTTTNGKKIYINGVLNSKKTSNISEIAGTYNYSFSITKANKFFNGSIERPQIWNRALSANEVKLLYESYNPCLKMTRALKGTFIDSRDGTEYKTIKIGNQTWMAENLKYLPSVVGPATGSITDPYQYVYDYNGTDVPTAKATTNYQTYGVLYNWTATTTACPAGWHLPSDEEYKTLEKYLGMTEAEANLTNFRNSGDVGTKLKSGGSSNFNGLMAGYRNTDGSFGRFGTYAHFWTSTPSYAYSSWWRSLIPSSAGSGRYGATNDYGFSVRCIRDY